MRPWIASILVAASAAISGPASAESVAAKAWQDVGAPVDDNHLSRSPALTIGRQQLPAVAYVRTTAQSDGRQVPNIFVEGFDGSAWQPVGGGALNIKPRFAAELPRIAADRQNRLVVAWYESQTLEGGRYAVFVKRWNGTAWEPLGAALNTDVRRSALSPSLALDGDGQPVVALAEASEGGLAVRVRRWDGAQWQLVGGPGDIGLGADTQVAVDAAGRITVAFTREVQFGLFQVLAKRWGGAQWLPLGGVPNRDSGRPSNSPSLGVAADGNVWLAWQEQADNASKVYAARWDDAAVGWAPVGDALDGGVAARSTLIPKLALQPDGLPIVAWTEAQTFQTHVHRWNGKAWRAVGNNPVITAEQRGYALQVDGKGRPVLAHGESRAVFEGDVRVKRFGR
jgi:hypothetical protein